MIHELGHNIGLYHEQSRTDRDSYVNILEENIQAGALENFKSYNSSLINSHERPYDYDSIMHYENEAFAKAPGLKTIIAKDDPNRVLGQRVGLSDEDVLQVERLYNCTPKPPPPCTLRRNPVKSGSILSINIKPRKWVRCLGTTNTCKRMSCRSLTRSNCDSIPTTCGGDVYKIQVQGRLTNDELYDGDSVMFEAVNMSSPAWLQCSYNPEEESTCKLNTCPQNSPDMWNDCKGNAFTVVLHNHTSNNDPTQRAIQDDDKIALCQVRHGRRVCLSCSRSIRSCQLIPCSTDIMRCPGVSLSLRQWINIQDTEN